jgi:hypothetical protein
LGERGVRHSVEVTADILYEAAAQAVAMFKQSDWADVIGPSTELAVAVKHPETMHRVTLSQIRRCCDGVAVSPDEILKRRRVKVVYRQLSIRELAVSSVRPNITIDTSKPERAAAQPQWWVHRKWIEELYQLRNESAHGGTTDTRDRGWSAFQHLVIAAFVFPLVVKLLLEREGFYELSTYDAVRCKAVDKLLAIDRWAGHDDECASRWDEVISKLHTDEMWEVAFGQRRSN